MTNDKIQLTFKNPTSKPADSEEESYVFVSSGFYHGLRTYLYPDVDTSDSWKQHVADYVKQLEMLLQKNVMFFLSY